MEFEVVIIPVDDNYLYCCISGNDAANETVFGELRRRKDQF